MKKINYYLALCLLLLTTAGVYAGNTRVIGYFPSYRATTDVSAQCAKMTDIIFSFINPKTDGTLETGNVNDAVWGFDMSKFIIVKDAAALKGTNLWIAVGGADVNDLRASRLSSVCNNSTYKNNLATDLVNFAVNNSCYGISIDWEFPKDATAKAGHLALLQALATKIAASTNPNIKVAIAVGGETSNQVNHTQYLDPSLFTPNANSALVNEWHIMAYDFPSSYNVSHASFADAQTSMDGWMGKGVPYNKMVLGVPFYGVDAARSNNKPSYKDLTPKGNTTYTSDLTNGYYYNGINTLKAKIDLVVSTKQAMGILIWDLGQDFAPSDAVSLLGGMDTYLSTLCPVPKPNLGPDKGVCAPNSITLDPGIPTATGRVFSWYKDNVLINGQTGTTLSVSTAGTYRVHIAQNSCFKEDEIVVVTGAPFNTTGANGCSGTTLQLAVSNPDQLKTYDWYDAAIGGTKVNTGTTYSKVFNATTTYYVEEKASGVTDYTSAVAQTSDAPSAVAWIQNTATYRANRLNVLTDLTLKNVRVFTSQTAGATFKIRVLKSADNTLVAESTTYTYAPKANPNGYDIQDLLLNIPLTVGDYFVYAQLTAGEIVLAASPNTINVGLGSTQANVYDLEKNCYTDFNGATGGDAFVVAEKTDAVHIHYGCLFKFVIETGANASCGRTAVTATVKTCGPPTVTISAPTANQDFPFNGNPITLTATVVDETSVTNVSFEIWDGATKLATITPSANGSVYSGTWTATTWYSSKLYTLKVVATDNDANVTTQPQNFTVSSSVGVVEVLTSSNVSVYPNPTSDNINVTIDLSKGGNSSIEVYDLAGRMVYSANTTLNAGKNINSISVNNLNAGTYLLKISVDGQAVNKSFSVVK